jgi:hypothetical protein
VVSLVQARIHRIRYLWPYSSSQPTIIRDLGFSIADNTSVKIQRINWMDPERIQFQFGKIFTARIHDSGFYRYDFNAHDFELANEAVGTFDPLGNWAYRAYLLRPSDERPLFKILTYVLLTLFVLAGITATASFVRAQARRAR